MDNAIEIRDPTKTYGTGRGLAGLTLDVRVGEVFGYLGPNGAGKSTTIRLLLDLIRPSRGAATVLGLDPLRDGVALRRRVGYLAGDFVVDRRAPESSRMPAVPRDSARRCPATAHR
jgi:ABC-2 type transport system ATP-binding protein